MCIADLAFSDRGLRVIDDTGLRGPGFTSGGWPRRCNTGGNGPWMENGLSK